MAVSHHVMMMVMMCVHQSVYERVTIFLMAHQHIRNHFMTNAHAKPCYVSLC